MRPSSLACDALAVSCAVRDKAKANDHELSTLTFKRRLLAWTLYGRSLVEDVAAAPEVPRWMVLAAERTQRQMLAALLGSAAVDSPAMAALAPFCLSCLDSSALPPAFS